jgi:ABC-type uncharacterized transport system ATPase component
MAVVTKVHGFAAPGEFVGRNLFFKNFAKGSAMSQADLDALVQEVQKTVTIEVIGSFTAGTSTSVNMVVSGDDVSAASGYTVTNVSGF